MPKITSFIVFISFFIFIACSPSDPCHNISCLNDGTCVNGKCQCEDGFSGTNCEVNNKCQNIECLNGGKCNKGDCICLEGWEGKSCQARSTEVWTGDFSAKDSCKKSGRTFYDLSIEQSETDLFRIWLNNFHGWRDLNGAMDSIDVKAKGLQASIATQTVLGETGKKFMVSGKGDLVEMDPMRLEFEVAIQFGSVKDSCWCTFTKN